MRNFLLTILSITLFIRHSTAQNHIIDSLEDQNKSIRSQVSVYSNDTTLINVLNTLAREFINIGSYKTADSITNEALTLEEKLLSSHDKNKITFSKSGKARSLSNLGIVNSCQGNQSKALDYFHRALDITKELGDKVGISKNLGNIGNVLIDQGNYPKALEFYFNALKLTEELNNDRATAVNLGNIGNVYKAQTDYPKSLEYYFKALKLAQKMKDNSGIAVDLSNIGIVYKSQGKYDEALDYYFKALAMAENLQHKLLMLNTLGNIGGVYSNQEQFSKALEYFNKALLIAEELGNKGGISRLTGNIGSAYTDQKKYTEAEIYLQKALKIANETGDLNEIKEQHQSLSRLYRLENKWEKALTEYDAFISTRDSLFNEENTKRTVRSELNFEYEKKATADSVKNAGEQKIKNSEIQAQQAQLKQERTQRYSLYGGLLLVLIFSGFLFNRFQFISKQKRVIEHQKKFVEEKNKEVIDSINYARRIQDALLKEDEGHTSHLPEHFILFKAKDIVSGDFYWSIEKNDFWYFCVADCTGHGVPGAFMSMLGIAYLNEITAAEKILTPAEILDALREKIVKELKQKGESGESKDGMDISLIRLNRKKKELQWAGANSPLWINKINNASDDMLEMRPDKQPIGYTIDPHPFTNNTVSIAEGDIIYLFTDGYADQFGGDKGKKFKKKSLKKLLAKNHSLSLPEQKIILSESLENWKGNNDQVDDITIAGLRF